MTFLRRAAGMAGVALGVLVLGACSSDDYVTGASFWVTEVDATVTEGPIRVLGTCTFPGDRFRQAEAEGRGWALGSEIRVLTEIDRSCGGWFGGTCPALDVATSATDSAVWKLVSTGGTQSTLRAVGEGTGGVTVRAGDHHFGPLRLRSVAASRIDVTRHVVWYGKLAMEEPAGVFALVAGGSTTLLVRAADAQGTRLCGRAPLGTAESTGLVVNGDASRSAAVASSNASIVVTADATPRTANLVLTLAGARAAMGVDVIDVAAVDAFDAAATGGLDSPPLLRLHAQSSGREVLGVRFRVENLSSVVLLDERSQALPQSFETTQPALLLAQGGPSAEGRIRLSVPGSSVAPREIAFTVPSSTGSGKSARGGAVGY